MSQVRLGYIIIYVLPNGFNIGFANLVFFRKKLGKCTQHSRNNQCSHGRSISDSRFRDNSIQFWYLCPILKPHLPLIAAAFIFQVPFQSGQIEFLRQHKRP